MFLLFAVPPHLKGDGMYDITLKKGRPIRYDIWFGGEPAPNVEWLREGRTLGPDENTSIELYSKNTIYTEKNTVLSIPKVQSFYFVHFSNTWGNLQIAKCLARYNFIFSEPIYACLAQIYEFFSRPTAPATPVSTPSG